MTYPVAYQWNDILPYGEIIAENIYTDIMVATSFIERAKNNNYEVLQIHIQGVIVRPITGMTLDQLNLRINDLRTDFNLFKESMDGDFQFFDQRIEQVKTLIDNKKTETTTPEEVGREFYLLFDMLPEHIRKEIKIYIKNEDNVKKETKLNENSGT